MPVIWIGKVLLRMYLSGNGNYFGWPPCLLEATTGDRVLAKTQEHDRNQDVSQMHLMNLGKLNLFENIFR